MLTYRTLPVPALEERTAKFVAGSVTIGVEYRLLDEQTILDHYGPDAREQFDNVAPTAIGDVVEEDGLCLHVFGTEDALEYLRFDCFADAPHYHYLDPHAPVNVVVEYDAAADGPMIDWTLRALGTRLREMLSRAGAVDLATSVDRDAIARVLLDVQHRAVEAIAERSRR